MYEELLIENKSQKTKHPLIFRANEKSLDPEILWPILQQLKNSFKKEKEEIESLQLLKKLIPEWEVKVEI